MKKLISILLLSLCLFNWFGYRLLISVLEDQANLDMEARLDDQHYSEDQLIHIKIPVTYLPYYNNSSDYERVYGQIEIEGLHYTYVKRRIFNDSLDLVCIRNTAVTSLRTAKNEFFIFTNDLQHAGQNKAPASGHKLVMGFSTDYVAPIDAYPIDHFVIVLSGIHSHYLAHLSSPCRPSAEQPPEQLLHSI